MAGSVDRVTIEGEQWPDLGLVFLWNNISAASCDVMSIHRKWLSFPLLFVSDH